jgi:uncharacterized protein (TIGR03437 family)
VSFSAAAPVPTTLSAAQSAVTLQQSSGTQPQPKATLTLSLPDKTQAWTASVTPGNRTTAWLSLSQYSGTGPTQITLTASGAGFEAGVYRALVTFQSPNAVPQTVTVPVMFVWGVSLGSSISSAANALSFKSTASPGEILAVFGSQLSNSVQQAPGLPLPFVMDGVAATVNGVAAPLYYTAPGQLNIQIPYEAGAGPAVLGINNHGQIAGFQFQITPSAPAISTDGNGNVFPGILSANRIAQGQVASMYMTGDGDVTPTLATGATPATGTALASLPKTRLPVTVTVGGVQAFLQFIGVTPGVVGLTQVNFIVPGSVPAGVQPVVVTVGGVASPVAYLTVPPSL